MKLRLLPLAELEAAEAVIWYDKQRLGLGDGFLAQLSHIFDRIRDAPRGFAIIEYYAGPLEIRRALLERFPYVVIYQCRPHETLVVAITHVRRRPLYWLERLG